MILSDVSKQYLAEQPVRAARVARGLAKPDTRAAYLTSIKKKARRLVKRTSAHRGEKQLTQCLVCGSRSVSRRHYTHKLRPGRTFEFQVCRSCDYVANPDNTVAYTAFKSTTQFRSAPRIGTEDRPGREFAMAQMGIEMLGRRDLTIMVYGIGRSVDYRHIATLPEVSRVVVGDIVDFGQFEDFVNLSEGTTEKFDLVIAAEVVEHFDKPQEDFRRLFAVVNHSGLVICSTNMYDGGDIAKQEYIFHGGHLSYYGARSLQHIAKLNKMYVDFRLPHVATGYAGPRKRYVLFSRSAATMQGVVRYFGEHPFAPSEPPTKP